MPDHEELEQMLDYKDFLDPYEISRLEQMDRAAQIMDEHDSDEGVEYGYEAVVADMG